jgi:hypothetical protein
MQDKDKISTLSALESLVRLSDVCRHSHDCVQMMVLQMAMLNKSEREILAHNVCFEFHISVT